MVPAQVWTTDWGQVATGRFGKAGEPARVPPRAPLPSGRCPLYDQARPATPLLDSSAHTRRPSRRPPHRLGPRCPACSTARPRLPPPRCGHRGRGALVVGAGPWTRIAPGVDHGVERLQRPARRPLDGPGAHRVGGLRGPSPLRSTPIVDARWWRISRTVMPPAYKLMIIESRPPGPALSPWATRRGAERARPAPWEATGLEGAHLRINGLGRSPASSCWDAPTEPTRPSRSPGDRSAQRPARVPGATLRAKRGAGHRSQ